MLKMLSILSRSVLILMLLMAVGCGKTPRSGEFVELEKRPEIVMPVDKGVVYFVRDDSFIGCAVSYYILENDKPVGALENGTYFALETEEGKHTYGAETESKTFITVDVKNGQASYIIGGVSIGAIVGRPSLEEVSKEEAMKMLEDEDIHYLRRNKEVELQSD